MRHAGVCILSVFVLAILAVFADSADAQGCTPPANGDWLVNETLSCSGQNIVLNGSLLVNGSGNLTLKDSTLLFNSTYDGQFGVEANGSLYVFGSSVENGTGRAYTFVSTAGANLEIRNSSVRGCGFASSDIRKRGVYIRSSGANVTNTTFANNYLALMIHADNGYVAKNRFVSNAGAVSLNGSGVNFDGNVIENGTGSAPAAELQLTSSLVNNNSLSNNTGGGLRFSGNGNDVTNNRITYNLGTGLDVINAQNTRITGNTILGNDNGLYISYSRDLSVSNSLCNMSSQYDVYMLSSPNITFSNVNYTSMLRKWRLNVRVLDNASNPVDGADVVIKNSYSATVHSGAANSTGSIPQQFLDERKENQSGVFIYNPYSLNVSKSGYYGNYTVFNLTGDLSIDAAITPFALASPAFSFVIISPKNATYLGYNLSMGGMLPLNVSSESNMSSCNYSVSDIEESLESSGPRLFNALLNASELNGTYEITFSCVSTENITNSSGVSFTVYPSYECMASRDCGGVQVCTGHKCENLECECGYAQNHTCINYECCDDIDCGGSERCDGGMHNCAPVVCGCPEKIGNHRCNMGVGYCCNDMQCDENETCDLGRHECVSRSLSFVIPSELVYGRNVTVKVLDQDSTPVGNVRIDVKYIDTDPLVVETYYTDSAGTAEIEIKHAGNVEFVARKGGYFLGHSSGEIPGPFNVIFLIEIVVLVAAAAGIGVTAFKLLKGGGKGVSLGKGPLKLEKTVSGTTVMLHIRNRTKKKLEDVIIRDSVPAGAFIQCAIRPRIEPLDARTSALTWEILELGPYEEVTIQYETYRANPGFSAMFRGKEYMA